MANDLTVNLGNVPYSATDNHRYGHQPALDSVVTNGRMIKENRLRLNVDYDSLMSYNAGYYVKGSNGTRFYFFITNVEYINENCCEISISIDWFTTDYSKITFKPSAIQRMHPKNKSDLFTEYPEVPEAFQYGDKWYYSNQRYSFSKGITYLVGVTNAIPPFALGTEEHPAPTTDYLYIQNPFPALANTTKTCGILQGCTFYVCSEAEAQQVLKNATDWGYNSAVTGIWGVPSEVIAGYTKTLHTEYITANNLKLPESHPFTVTILSSTDNIVYKDVITVPAQPQGTVLYSKCYSSQFYQVYIRTNGIIKLYNTESLVPDAQGSASFYRYFSVSPEAELYVFPRNYQGYGAGGIANYYDGVSLPLSIGGTLTADNVNNSFRQAKVQLANDIAMNLAGGSSDIINAGSSAIQNDTALPQAIANIGTAGLRAASDMFKSGIRAYNTMRTPDLTHSTVHSSGVACLPMQLPANAASVDVGVFRIQDNDLARLNKYFSVWGYNYAGAVDTPYVRDNYSFIQGDINFDGNISAQSRDYIKALFSAGVTIWNTDMYSYDA